MNKYDAFIVSLDSYISRGLLVNGAHTGIIGNIYYSHDKCSESLDNLIPDPYFLHKRERVISISKRFSSDFNVLEVGVNAGHSAVLFLMANNLCNYMGVDNAKSYFDGTYDLRSDLYVLDALKFVSNIFYPRVDYRIGNSFDVIEQLCGDTNYHLFFDVLHLDAQKDYYYKDFIQSIPLLKDGAVIIIDDTTNLNDTARHTTNRLINEGYLTMDDVFDEIKSNAICIYTGKR